MADSSSHGSHGGSNQRKHHKHHGRRSHKGDAAVEASRRKKKVAAAIAGIALVVGGAFAGVRIWENGRYQITEPAESRVQTKAVISAPKTMEIAGTGYIQRGGVDSYLFMGVDVLEGEDPGSPEYNGGRQADFFALLVIDDEAKTWQIVHINRDTMTDVPVLNFTGRIIGYDKGQIALSYAYGDDDFSSCTNAARTVSALFNGQDIDGYLSIQMDGVAVLNDAVGGVELEVRSDFSSIDESLVQGETVRLDGTQALEYVRSRHNVDDETNLARMERQRQFMAAFLEQATGLTDRQIVDVYDAIDQYSYSNMGSGQIVDIADRLNEYEQMPTIELEGEAVLGEQFMEYWLDDESLQRTTAGLFYKVDEA